MSTGSLVASGNVDATGFYSLSSIPLSTAVYINVSFQNYFFYYSTGYDRNNGTKTATSLTLTSDKTLNLVTPGSMWSGTVVNVNGAPVGSVHINGYYFDLYSYSNFSVVTSATGDFSVHVLGLNPYSVTFIPPYGSPLLKQTRYFTINSTSHQTIVLQTSLPSASPSQAPTFLQKSQPATKPSIPSSQPTSQPTRGIL
jgi:hypothetical protein